MQCDRIHLVEAGPAGGAAIRGLLLTEEGREKREVIELLNDGTAADRQEGDYGEKNLSCCGIAEEKEENYCH